MKNLSMAIIIFFSFFCTDGLAKVKKPAPAEMLPWKEVNELLPRYSKFIVRDLETGKQFQVQRRAGSQHADVQPLTAKDTAIMKRIYNGSWSWKRRAIIVIHNKKRIAASMHGMPHGAGALINNFPGHFCIHFYGSTTHRHNYMDPSHMLMIFKASGMLKQYLANASPYEVISAYIVGYKQQDPKIVTPISLQPIKWENILPNIENAAISSMLELPIEDLKDEIYLEVPVVVEWFIKGQGKRIYRGNVHLVRFSPIDPWKVDSITFLEKNDFLGES